MNISNWIKEKVLGKLGLIRLNNNPNDGRMTFINDDEAIKLSDIHCNRIWFTGDGDEILNWYTNQMITGFYKNIIYNRNKRQMFWSRAVAEMVKRIHSGVPKSIVDTITNIVGKVNVICDDPRLEEILKDNDFQNVLIQRARPLTLVEGDGCWKININPKLSKHPIIEYYSAEDYTPIRKSGRLIGLIFKSYFKDKKDNDYLLTETRSLTKEGLSITYNLFKLERGNYMSEVSFAAVPELEGLENQLLPGVNKLCAVVNRYYFDTLNPDRGKSIYDGKIDLFDMLDEILTQAGQTNRVSTPVEYYPIDLLPRTQKGAPVLPHLYNRQYVKVDATPDGDGAINNEIKTTQPDLNFDKYMQLYSDILEDTLIGILSPSSFGINIARNDNALAQREKEKQTIFTRNNIISCETVSNTELFNTVLMMQDYMDTGILKSVDYNISVKYDEFANPSFESELEVLGPAWSQGELSTERYVNLLWAGKLSDEEMLKEIEWLDNNKNQDDFDMEALMGHENEVKNRTNLPESEADEEETAESEE